MTEIPEDKKRAPKERFRMALLPPNPTDEELQRFADFLSGELEEAPQPPPRPPKK